MSAQVINHYGKWIHSEIPVTGVLSWNEIDNIEFLVGNEICLTCEEILENIENDDSLSDDEKEDEKEFLECDSSHTRLLGDWIKDSEGLYIPDKTGEFSAIENESTIQVIWSKYTAKGNPCSPCYPGQVEFSNEGEFLAYTLPDEFLYKEDQD